jgi:histidinol phosphatase-like enzyme
MPRSFLTSRGQEIYLLSNSHDICTCRKVKEKYLPSFGNVVSLDLAISSVAKMAATDIQTELKAMYRPGHFLYAFEYEKGQP